MTKRAFFQGIKGVGMTALACSMQDAGWVVEGCDTDESFITDEILRQRDIRVSPHPQTAPPDNTDLIIHSAAYTPPDSKTRTLSLAEALAEFVADKQVIAVAGVGGKTTTTAMLSVLLREAGRDVGYYLGTSEVSGLPAPGAYGQDPYFIIEADEYSISKTDHRPKFALLSPRILVTTNIIHDHPDIYPDPSATLETFSTLVQSLRPGSTWISSAADPLTQQILEKVQKDAKDINIIQYSTNHPLYSRLRLSVFGQLNHLDALAATLAAIVAGVSEQDALAAISAYKGAKRRQERVGEVKGRLLYDDYGHHPTEIKATLAAFRQEFPTHRLVLIFESHTYSRTEALFQEFAAALAGADQVYVMPIFESAREKDQSHSVTHQGLAQAVAKLGTPAQAIEWDNAASVIAQDSKSGDLLLTMGAGFVYKLHQDFKQLL